MKTRKTRIFSAILTVCMLFTLLPPSAFAAETVASGYCGGDSSAEYDEESDAYKNLSWTLDSDGLLTISGTGAMTNYSSYTSAPWCSLISTITSVTISAGVTSIGASAFSSCISLTSIRIPSSVTRIVSHAFYYCISLTSVTIPDSVTSIGDDAFSLCSSLTSISIPNSVTSISDDAFFHCSGLTSITVDSGNAVYDSRGNCNAIVETATNALITGCKSTVIPSSVTSIGNFAFAYCSSLTSINIPDSVTSIGSSAFCGCSSLTSINIPNSVTSIGGSAFYDCSSLTSITIPDSVTSIGNCAFRACKSLSSVSLGNGVTSIEAEAFRACSSLTSITIPNSVTSIDRDAFYKCSSLTSITIPNSVTSIGGGAFEDCSSLTSITIPNSVTSIGGGAFRACSRLTSITIPNSVTSIGFRAFYGCKSLTDIYYTGTETQWTEISIDNGNERLTNATIHYNWTLQDSQTEVTVHTESYYQATETRLFRVLPVGASFPTPAGFSVTVGSNEYSSGKATCTGTDDITATIPSNFSRSISIAKDGYYPYSLPASLTGQYNVVSMIPTTVTSPFAQTLLLDESKNGYASFCNLLGESATLYEPGISGTESVKLYPSVNWNGHGEGTVWLEQGEVIVELQNNTMNTKNWTSCAFSANLPIYLCAKAADGTTIKTKTQLNVCPSYTSGIKLNLGQTNITMDTGESNLDGLSILSDESLKFDLKELSDGVVPISFTIKNDGSVEGVIGVSFKDSDKQAVFGTMKNSINEISALEGNEVEQSREIAKLLKEMKRAGITVPKSSEFGVSGSFSVMGYFTGKRINGKIKLTEAKTVAVFEGKLSYTYNTVITVGFIPVPAYFKASLSTKLEWYLKMVYDELLEQLEPDGKQHLDATIALSVETGPGWEGGLSGGVKGSGKLKVKSEIPLAVSTTSASIKGEFSFVGTLLGFEGEWKFYETDEKVFWDAGEWCWKDSENDNATLCFVPNLQVNLMGAGQGNEIASGVSGYAAPGLIELSDGRLLAVWTASVAGRKAADKNGIWYSIYDDSTWSEAALVSDDGSNDSLPQLYCSDGEVYLAWKNYATVFNTDFLPEYNTVAEQIETVVSTFDNDTGSWSEPESNEPTWYQQEPELPDDYDDEWPVSACRRQTLVCDTTRAVLYITEDSNGIAQVYGLFNDGYNWGQPIQLTDSDESVNTFCASLNAEEINILYTDGAVSNADISLKTVSLSADLSVTDADYIRQTFVPGNPLTMTATVKNNSPVTVNGVHVCIKNGTQNVYEDDIAVRFDSGEEDCLYINYDLPDTIDFDKLTVSVTPLVGTDADLTDNEAVCTLYTSDLSVENASAKLLDGTVNVVAQVVNRGNETSASTTVSFFKNSPDGEAVYTQSVSELNSGELINISVSLTDLEKNDMVYVKVDETKDENLISNNTTQALVLESEKNTFSAAASAERDGSDVVISIRLYNQTAEDKAMNVFAVAYDADSGQMLAVKEVYNLCVSAVGLCEENISLSVESNTNVMWKVFVTDEEYAPIENAFSGVLSSR